MRSMWTADSDRDYAEELHCYDEPTQQEPERDVRPCLKCKRRSAHWQLVPGGVWCDGCYFSRAEVRQKGAA